MSTATPIEEPSNDNRTDIRCATPHTLYHPYCRECGGTGRHYWHPDLVCEECGGRGIDVCGEQDEEHCQEREQMGGFLAGGEQ